MSTTSNTTEFSDAFNNLNGEEPTLDSYDAQYNGNMLGASGGQFDLPRDTGGTFSGWDFDIHHANANFTGVNNITTGINGTTGSAYSNPSAAVTAADDINGHYHDDASTLSTVLHPHVLIQGQADYILPNIPINSSEDDGKYHSLTNSDTRSRDPAQMEKEGDEPKTLLHSADMNIHSTDGIHFEEESVPYSDFAI